MNELEVFSFFQNEVKMIEKENKSLHHFIRILIALDLNRWKAAVFPMHFSSSEIFFQFKTKSVKCSGQFTFRQKKNNHSLYQLTIKANIFCYFAPFLCT